MIETTFRCIGFSPDRRVIKLYSNDFYPSIHSFQKHIHVEGLTEDCQLTLSDLQVDLLHALI
jgi:hypothetical protein